MRAQFLRESYKGIVKRMNELTKDIIFDEEKHIYYYKGKRVPFSVTQALRLGEASVDYSGVPQWILDRAAERGNKVHKEIEEYIKFGKEGDTEELQNYKNIVKRHRLVPIMSEFRLGNELVAGTVDLLFVMEGDNEIYFTLIIADTKTTSSLHTDSISWQLSIYNYLGNINADKGGCIFLPKNGVRDFHEIPLKTYKQVEEFLEKLKEKVSEE